MPSVFRGNDNFDTAGINALRAWVNFNGTNGSIRASGNVTSVTRNGTGDYTVNFTTALPDANYAASIKASNDFIGVGFAYDGRGQVNTTTSMRFTPAKDSSGNLSFDSVLINVAIFR